MKWLSRLFRGGVSQKTEPIPAKKVTKPTRNLALDWRYANAQGIASHCLARGRYELALQFHRMHISFWESVVSHPEPCETREDRRIAREQLKFAVQKLSEFPLLVESRGRLIDLVAGYPDGVERNTLKDALGHKGETAFGVICNQLARGGWIVQKQAGKKQTLFPSKASLDADETFLRVEINSRFDPSVQT